MTIRKKLSIVSSGDPDKDRARLEAAQLHEQRIAANICANGCGKMVWDDPHTRHCPICNFSHWSSKAHVEGEA